MQMGITEKTREEIRKGRSNIQDTERHATDIAQQAEAPGAGLKEEKSQTHQCEAS